MKKTFILGLSAFMLGLALNAQAAPDRVGRTDWGVSVAATANDGNIDDSALVSTAFSHGVTPNVGLGLEGDFQLADATGNDEIGMGLVLGTIIGRIPTIHENLVPYGVVGLGYGHAYVTNEDSSSPFDNDDDIDDGGFAYKLGGGVDWFVNTNWIVNLEVAYYDMSADLPGSGVTSDPDFWSVGGGLKFVF